VLKNHLAPYVLLKKRPFISKANQHKKIVLLL